MNDYFSISSDSIQIIKNKIYDFAVEKKLNQRVSIDFATNFYLGLKTIKNFFNLNLVKKNNFAGQKLFDFTKDNVLSLNKIIQDNNPRFKNVSCKALNQKLFLFEKIN